MNLRSFCSAYNALQVNCVDSCQRLGTKTNEKRDEWASCYCWIWRWRTVLLMKLALVTTDPQPLVTCRCVGITRRLLLFWNVLSLACWLVETFFCFFPVFFTAARRRTISESRRWDKKNKKKSHTHKNKYPHPVRIWYTLTNFKVAYQWDPVVPWHHFVCYCGRGCIMTSSGINSTEAFASHFSIKVNEDDH